MMCGVDGVVVCCCASHSSALPPPPRTYCDITPSPSPVFHVQAAAAAGTFTIKAPWAAEEVYGAALEALCYHDIPASVAALCTLQRVLDGSGWPKGVMEGTFMALYNSDIMQDEAFTAWKDADSDVPGKMKAIFQTNRWFGWLEEQQAASDSESESEEDSDDDADIIQAGRAFNTALLR
jgi:hypothetical protein